VPSFLKLHFVVLAFAAATAAQAQTACNPWKIQTFSTDLTLEQRLCFGLSEMASPSLGLGAAFLAGYSQWRNSPHMNKTDDDDIAVRFEHLYERRAARLTGEILVGYLHHEDPRQHLSHQTGNLRRTRAALLSVLISPDADGNARLALAPIAGSFGSGLTSMALYQRQNSLDWGLERTGLAYARYFARAVVHEFSPELWSLAPPFIRKFHQPAN